MQYATPWQPRDSSKRTSRDGFKKCPKGDSGRIFRDCCPICLLLDPSPGAHSLPSALTRRKRTTCNGLFCRRVFSLSLLLLSLFSHRPPGTPSSAKQSAQTAQPPAINRRPHNRLKPFPPEIQEGRNVRTRADRAFPGATSASLPPSSVSIRLLLSHFLIELIWIPVCLSFPVLTLFVYFFILGFVLLFLSLLFFPFSPAPSVLFATQRTFSHDEGYPRNEFATAGLARCHKCSGRIHAVDAMSPGVTALLANDGPDEY